LDITTLNILVGVCLATGLAMLAFAFFPANTDFLAKRLDEGNGYQAGTIASSDGQYALLKMLLPYAQKLSARNAGKVNKDKLKEIDRKLTLAGSPLTIKAIEFYNMRFVGAIAFFIAGIIFSVVLEMGPVLSLIAACIGYVLPDKVIDSLIKKRANQGDMELPEVLDLLSVCMDSGMTITTALETVCAKNEGLLVEELKLVLADTTRGASLIQAFEGLLRRVNSKRLAKMLQAVKLSETYGTPIAGQLKIMSDLIRNDTFEMVKQHAAKAASTVMIPVIFFILPAMVLSPATSCGCELMHSTCRFL
jgi:tight adherence protein C